MDVASREGRIDLSAVRAALAELGTDAASRLLQLDVSLVPEITAAITSFTHSPERELGLYAMVDVGAGTLDCCTFNIFTGGQQSEFQTAIFVADVAMRGVDSWEVCKGDAKLAMLFEKEIRIHEQSVIWETKQRRYRNSERWRTELPVFLVGGGASSDFFRRTTANLDPWLKKFTGGRVALRSLRPSAGLVHECTDGSSARLVVADGLAFPRADIPDVRFPTSIDDQIMETVKDMSDRYISKDMT